MSNTPDPRGQTGRDNEPAEVMPEDPGLFQAVQEYLQELEKGGRPDRRQWLARHPDIASALNECLEGLEFVHRAAGSVGASKPLAAEAAPPLQSGLPVGDFQVVREIGRGGMGIIYEAMQLSLGRRVALKVLPYAASLDAKYLERFRQEAQAAAQLHHTNIVPVYAVGCERGIHFYAMQLIDGYSLDHIIRQLRREAGLDQGECPATVPLEGRGPGGPPSASAAEAPRPPAASQPAEAISADFSTQRGRSKSDVHLAVARFMAQAAEALEYAHQQGIIHRDIKPANLLIDTRNNLWITDFGLAHLHGEQNLTRTGDLLGTIRYASPEQVSGQRVVLDHRTDIYSLGATFYELLTLRPIFPGPTRQTLLHQVLNQEPLAPRSLDRSIPAELETILLKSLGKDPAERYDSAQALADDLHRFLRDEPIEAKRPTPLERVRKWSRRHPSVVAAAVAVMFVTLVVSGVSNWRISRANVRTQTALDAARLRAEEAEKRFRQARQAVDVLIEISENDLADKPPLRPLQKRLLEIALVYYQDFIAQHRGNPAGEAELVSVQQRLKKVLDDLSVVEGAGQLVVLADKNVQEDLALDPRQRERVEAVTRRFSERRMDLLRDFERLPPNARRARFLELARAGEQAVRSALTPRQLRRVEQISLQLQGLMALSQPEVVAKLKLTEPQRQALRQIEMEMFVSMAGQWNLSDEPPPPGMRDEAFRAAMQKSLALLTPEQLSTWKELIGPPLRGRLSIPPGVLP